MSFSCLENRQYGCEVSYKSVGEQDSLYFFGGRDYLDLYHRPTRGFRGKRVVFYKSRNTPKDAKLGVFIHWGVYAVPAFGNEWYPCQA